MLRKNFQERRSCFPTNRPQKDFGDRTWFRLDGRSHCRMGEQGQTPLRQRKRKRLPYFMPNQRQTSADISIQGERNCEQRERFYSRRSRRSVTTCLPKCNYRNYLVTTCTKSSSYKVVTPPNQVVTHQPRRFFFSSTAMDVSTSDGAGG